MHCAAADRALDAELKPTHCLGGAFGRARAQARRLWRPLHHDLREITNIILARRAQLGDGEDICR